METVSISRAEYEALLAAQEALDDIRAYDLAMADITEGLPHSFMVRLLDGETPLTVFREWRGLTKVALSAASGVNRVQITEIEAGRKTGSVATLRRLADALDIPLDDLA
ncbi:MAG: helix-turn-helix transcriptional regulator [Pseudomonadota bacterium]